MTAIRCRAVAASLLATGIAILTSAGAVSAAQDATAGLSTKPRAFVGYCVEAPAAEDGTCVLDEPEGTDPETYGTLSYDRTFSGVEDTIAFDFPDGLVASEAKVCLTLEDDAETNPYVPTRANTCAGKSSDRAYEGDSPPDPLVIDLAGFFAGNPLYAPGGGLWFTLNIRVGGRTLAATGGSYPGHGVTRAMTVTKDVVPDSDDAFAFTLRCWQTSLSPANTPSPGVVFSNGTAAFSLGDGGEVTFTGIADDDTCTVVEGTPDFGAWETSVDGKDDDAVAVPLSDGDVVVSFVNRALRALTIVKDVVSPTGSESAKFTVDCGTYVLSTANNGDFAIGYLDGDAVFTLGDLGTMTLSGIPDGTACRITELGPDASDGTWSTTVDGVSGLPTTTVVLDRSRSVAFTNTLTAGGGDPTAVLGVEYSRELPATGGSSLLPLGGAALLVLGGMLLLASKDRRRTT